MVERDFLQNKQDEKALTPERIKETVDIIAKGLPDEMTMAQFLSKLEDDSIFEKVRDMGKETQHHTDL